LATEIETTSAAPLNTQLKIKDILSTAEKIADFVFAEEE
jgi:hypothetical protein